MRPVRWKELVKIAEEEGCGFERQEGSHYIMTRTNLVRPVVIPMRNNLKETIVFNIAKTLGLSNKEMRERLSRKKKKTKEGT